MLLFNCLHRIPPLPFKRHFSWFFVLPSCEPTKGRTHTEERKKGARMDGGSVLCLHPGLEPTYDPHLTSCFVAVRKLIMFPLCYLYQAILVRRR